MLNYFWPRAGGTMLYISAALVLMGLIVCVSGRTIFTTTPFLGGFLIGGLLGFELGLTFVKMPESMPFFVLPLASFLVGGLIGGVLAKVLYAILLAISGIALGSFIGLVAGYVINLGGNPHVLTTDFFSFQPENTVQLYAMVISAVIFGALAITSEELMTILSTAFFGAGIAVINLSDLFDATTNLTFTSNTVFVIFVWLFMGMFGMFRQNQPGDVD
jgi:hypothetical protein